MEVVLLVACGEKRVVAELMALCKSARLAVHEPIFAGRPNAQ
jgi:hypothetical protein